MKPVIKGTNIQMKDIDAVLRVLVNIKTTYDYKKGEIVQKQTVFHICYN